MAGDWIKMRSDLLTHPKVVRISSALQADKLRTIGGLHSAWCLFDVHTTDGRLEGYTPKTLDDHLGFAGFAQALIDVGWLFFENGNALVMPRFDEHNGCSAKKRAQDTRRKKDVRKTSATGAENCPPDERTKSGREADKNRTREEKRRKNTPLPPLPFSSDAFRDAWEEWAKHRSEIGKKLKPTTIEKQFKELAAMGEARAIAALGNSVKNGYMGIFESKSKAPEVNSDYERIKLHQMSGEDEDE